MNFRTTLILLILLLGTVAYVMFTGGNSSTTTDTKSNPQRLLTINTPDVSKVVLSPKEGKPIVLERATLTTATPTIETAKSDWKITSPITAYADGLKVNDLIDSVVSATSTSEAALAGGSTAEFGLDDPQYTIEIQAGAKSAKVIVGRQVKAGNELYVRIEGKDVAEVVGADLLDKLDTTADKLRLGKLITADSGTANWISIARPSDPLTLEKAGGNWEMSTTRPTDGKPTTLPVEQSVVSDVVNALSGATAVAFGGADADANIYIGTPKASITISDKKPSTQPSQSETIEFGQPDSLIGKNVWVRVTPPGLLATIPKDSMDTILKSSLDLRDHNVVQIPSSLITAIRIVKNTPAATQPIAHDKLTNSQEMSRRPKRKVVEGPPMPATQPTTLATTGPSTVPTSQPTTLASTQPVVPPSEWIVSSLAVKPDADDAKVDAAIASFNPLKVDKYLWARPATQPADPAPITYLVTLTTGNSETTITFTDPGDKSTQSPWGETDDAIFTVPRAVITALDADFVKH
jgi:hypothetical protein